MPFSHHSHSAQFCSHATNTLEEVVRRAISLKMEVFAMTEHMPRDEEDLYPEELEINTTAASLVQLFDDYYAEAVRLRQAYASQIKLLIGFETDWIRPSSLKLTEDLLKKYQVDLVVGSIHHVRTVPIDFDRSKYEEARRVTGGTDEKLFEAYFDEQYGMLQALKPPVVGHFDLIRLKSDDPERSFKQWAGVWDRVNRNLRFVADYGGIVELNSSALRKGMTEPYPKKEICEAFVGMGGRFTLSDDSHGCDQVGLNYGKVLDAIRSAGIQEIHFLS
ncbi:hypothetical protein B0A49_00529 [Cryomyces minteri]|uniref:Histidinol-phosphatase n=1 Tax=Cryomyces minteri TaxID=331657 RepID=A0A4U0Y0V9_9PEZI|nr:hypothetical protein B0A49_00529 [Cryomyces minteri]